MTPSPSAVKRFWSRVSMDGDTPHINPELGRLDTQDREETLSLLPDLEGRDVLELASGLGQYTGHLADRSRSVVTVEFVEAMLEKNRARHEGHQNLDFVLSDALLLDPGERRFDFCFLNWFMLYLDEDQCTDLVQKIRDWLRPGGVVYLRESCLMDAQGNRPTPETRADPTHYHSITNFREPSFYEELFSDFTMVGSGPMQTYVEAYDNPNQRWWIWRL